MDTLILLFKSSCHHPLHLCLPHSGPRWRAHFLESVHFLNSVQYFFPWDNVMYFSLCVFVYHSSLFTLEITACICSMCKHNICIQGSSCVHYSMKQWSFRNAKPFLKTLLLVNNSSCSKCCISCTLSLLILKVTQVTWFSLCTFKNTTEKWCEGRREFNQRFLAGIFQANVFVSTSYLSQGINYFMGTIFYLLD